MEIEEVEDYQTLPLMSLNHVSLLCASLWDSVRFYEDVLGFVLIKRPSSFNFNGAWLYNYGIAIHLIENPSMNEFDTMRETRPINPKDNHISFQCRDICLVKRRLQEMGMRYVTAAIDDDGVKVDQVFFHDPDGYMIEICNCEKIPILPFSSSSSSSSSSSPSSSFASAFKQPPLMTGIKKPPFNKCCFMETQMMENLTTDMMNFSF
ncbi:lactoylglutathione lyase-like isoform X2 [Carica papaya]|uniref:lactoylglutathione lyase-like isoform X2 n=1 Tax=Carica papaya TaxID=3649 RepID=UPI000B8CE56F|nr:lactoylglutathione lyase-like isoform X2 [Carica papaya]